MSSVIPRLYYLIFFLFLFYIILKIYTRCVQRQQRRERAEARGRLRLNSTNRLPTTGGPGGGSEPDVDIEQERENRRLLILTSVVVKKALHHDKKKNETGNSPQDSNNDQEKNNILVRSFRNGLAMVNGMSTNSLNDPNVCSICLEPYKDNDEICWSKNDECKHCFHLDCMTNWLMDHDECPICRSKYLLEKNATGDDDAV